jgi:hypothetical protein
MNCGQVYFNPLIFFSPSHLLLWSECNGEMPKILGWLLAAAGGGENDLYQNIEAPTSEISILYVFPFPIFIPPSHESLLKDVGAMTCISC